MENIKVCLVVNYINPITLLKDLYDKKSFKSQNYFEKLLDYDIEQCLLKSYPYYKFQIY